MRLIKKKCSLEEESFVSVVFKLKKQEINKVKEEKYKWKISGLIAFVYDMVGNAMELPPQRQVWGRTKEGLIRQGK